MCGILLHTFVDKPAPARRYEDALQAMAKRGPDYQKIEKHDGFVIGHTRLSIIDPTAAANQPFWDDEGRHVLTYNGEIYNHAELRSDLEAEGVRFNTNSDTEVLLKALLAWDIRTALRRFRGMFAFALHDTMTGITVAARDHFGQKPLYYANGSNGLILASDPIAVAKITNSIEPDFGCYQLYMATEAATGTRGLHHPDRSFLANINSLQSGHLLRYDKGDVKIERYFGCWELFDEDRYLQNQKRSDDCLMDELLELLTQSCRRHLVSDVPVGLFVSGGIDSSMLYWLTHEQNSDLHIFTKLSPGIETIPLDVVPKLLQDRPATAHFIVQEKSAFMKELVEFIGFHKAPSRWNSGPSMYSLSRSARQNGRIALSGGDCADEIFGGYLRYREFFEQSHNDYDLGDAVGISDDRQSSQIIQDYVANQRDIRSLILAHLDAVTDQRERFAQATLIHDATTFLQTCVLPHSDAYSMMASVELRNPMLDLDLAAFAINLPMRHKADVHRNGEFGKTLFRSLAEREIGRFTNIRKEGTRNYAMSIAEPEFWELSRFDTLQLPGITPPETKRDLIRAINLELFHRLFFDAPNFDTEQLLTSQGRGQLLN